MRTLHPTQIGTIESGFSATMPSQLIFGRDVGVISPLYEGLGFGEAGRPNFIENLTINLTKNDSSDKTINTNLTRRGSVFMSATGLAAISAANSHAPTVFTFTLKEVDVCEDGVAKKMVVLASQTYLP